MFVFFNILVCEKRRKTLPSAGHKVIKKSGLQQVVDHIKSLISEKCHNLGIVLDYSEELLQRGGSLTLHAHTKGKWAKILKSRHMTGNQIR